MGCDWMLRMYVRCSQVIDQCVINEYGLFGDIMDTLIRPVHLLVPTRISGLESICGVSHSYRKARAAVVLFLEHLHQLCLTVAISALFRWDIRSDPVLRIQKLAKKRRDSLGKLHTIVASYINW